MLTLEKFDPALLEAVAKLGCTELTPVQKKVIPLVMQGKDLLVSAKTGSGKTIAFLLPMLNQLLSNNATTEIPRTLILLPTRELAMQTLAICQQLLISADLEISILIGGSDFKLQLNRLAKKPDIIIATPGRLLEHMQEQSVNLASIEFLIIDEADRVLEMGHNEDVKKIADSCNSTRQNLFFSATLKNNALRSLSEGLLHQPQVVAIDDRRESPENISQQVILADDLKHKQELVIAIVLEEQANQVIVFCNTRTQCRQLGNFLLYKGVKADFLHGDIPQSKRSAVINDFREGDTEILVATDIAARGLDIEDIDLIINFDSPHNAEEYLHRCGRTGRAGKSGIAITLITAMEWNLISNIARYLRTSFQRRQIKGLVASYKGPKKLKKSGKAVGGKKKKKKKDRKRTKQTKVK